MGTKSEVPHSGDPNTRRLIEGRGVVEFGADGKPVKVWTRYGHDAPNPWLNNPLPRVTYNVGANSEQHKRGIRLKHIFETTFDKSTIRAEALCVRRYSGEDAGQRWNPSQCKPEGFPDPEGFPRARFDRGHLIAAEFGAGMEIVNLVTMPSSVNRAHRPETAAKQGFDEIAEIAQRDLNPGHLLKGTMNLRGKFRLPNYRKFEQVVHAFLPTNPNEKSSVALRIKPSVVKGKTDILYAEIWIGTKCVAGYEIECDVAQTAS